MRPVTRAPGMRSFIRFRQRRKVLFPHPDGPMRAVISLLRTSSVTSRKARNAPYQKLTPATSKTVGATSATTEGSTRGAVYGDCSVTWTEPLDNGITREGGRAAGMTVRPKDDDAA